MNAFLSVEPFEKTQHNTNETTSKASYHFSIHQAYIELLPN